MLRALLRNFVTLGRLGYIDPDGERVEMGEDKPRCDVVMRVTDWAADHRIALNPDLALGEAYADGHVVLEEGDLWDLMDLVGRNLRDHGMPSALTRMLAAASMMIRTLHQFNPADRARRNVEHHYDLSDRLYDLFLDPDRQYSCAYFPHPQASLAEAQEAKKRHIAAKLLIQPGQRILDIGCGWGGLALHLARLAKVEVLGVTLSSNQLRIARERAERAGLADRVRFELVDYRDLDERFDRIVSVGMFEHVGVPHYGTFFDKARGLLADDGVMLLHSIGRLDGPGVTSQFIRKHIFPGGYIPALSEVVPVVEKSGLLMSDVEILRLHYAETLRHWRRNFRAAWDEAKRLYDERFCRMWEFYLAGSEMGFRYNGMMVFQLQLEKRLGTVPITRDYIGEWERTAAPGRTEPLHGLVTPSSAAG